MSVCVKMHIHTLPTHTHTKSDGGRGRPLIAADTVCVQTNLASSAGLIRVTHWLWSNNNQSHTTSHRPAPQLRAVCFPEQCVCLCVCLDNHHQRRCVRSSCRYRCSWSLLGLPHRWRHWHTGMTNMHVPLMKGDGWMSWRHERGEKKEETTISH